MARYVFHLIIIVILAGCSGSSSSTDNTQDDPLGCADYAGLIAVFAINDTGQQTCYDENGATIDCPSREENLYGQDAQFVTVSPNFEVCDEGVVFDANTNLMWQRAHNDTRMSFSDAANACADLDLGGFSDWRLPDVKEAFSIANFSGTIDDNDSTSPSNPYVFDEYFDIAYDAALVLTGTHSIQMMGQTWTATSRPDDANSNYFYNFLDGHLKSQFNNNPDSTLFYRCVRGEQNFINNFTNNGDGTVTDIATGLMWAEENALNTTNSNYQFTWSEALAYCEDSEVAGYTDWRLPDVKALQSIVDYSDAANSIDSTVFIHTITSNTGPFFWSSTTDEETPQFANYVCFGPCWNFLMNADIHGPGAQRSSPKYDNGNLPPSLGDQEDLVQVVNYARCVR